MSDIPVNPMDPGEPTPVGATTGEGIAERFVDHELVDSRASLKRTQIIGVLLSVFVIAYMSYLTAGFRASLEPTGAATIATGLASQRLDDMEPQFADYIHEEVPKMIRSAPDEVIKRLPEYRTELERRVDSTIRTQAAQGSAQLDKQLDDFLTAHKEQVGNLLKNGQDPANLEGVGNDLETQFKSYLHDTKIGDTTIDEKLTETLKTLQQVSARTAKLAANKGLTPEEAKARHAVAMLMSQIGAAQAADPNAIPKLDPEAIKSAVNNAAAQVTDAVKSNLPATTGNAEPTTTMPTATPSAKTSASPAPKPAAPTSASKAGKA